MNYLVTKGSLLACNLMGDAADSEQVTDQLRDLGGTFPGARQCELGTVYMLDNTYSHKRHAHRQGMPQGPRSNRRSSNLGVDLNPFPTPGYVPVLDMSTWRTSPAGARRVDLAVTQDLVDVCSMIV